MDKSITAPFVSCEFNNKKKWIKKNLVCVCVCLKQEKEVKEFVREWVMEGVERGEMM